MQDLLIIVVFIGLLVSPAFFAGKNSDKEAHTK